MPWSLLLISLALNAGPAPGPMLLPTEVGTTWVYRSVGREGSPGDVRSWDITQSVRLLEVGHLNGATFLFLSGWPGMLTEPVVIVVPPDHFYYLVRRHYDQSSLKWVETTGQPLSQLLEQATVDTRVMRQPLVVGDLVGGDPDNPRKDGMYAWRVESVSTMTSWHTAGIPPGSKLSAYRLVWRSIPEHEFSTVVPGIGIVREEYAHHGSLSEDITTLVAFRRGSEKPPADGSAE